MGRTAGVPFHQRLVLGTGAWLAFIGWLACLIWRVARKPAKVAVISAGVLGIALCALACTRLPFDVHRRLGTAAGSCVGPPQAIVVLGGSGMPSGPELLRLHHAAQLALAFPGAQVVVVHPDNGSMDAMLGELLLRGVGTARLVPLMEGTNTRAQALGLRSAMPELVGRSVAVVTAPENMYRSVRTFRKAGFQEVCGAPAWDTPLFSDLGYDHRRIGGRAYVPDVSGQVGLRYTFWHHLKLEIACLRELAAIAYYSLNGWI